MSSRDGQPWFVLEPDGKPSGPHAFGALEEAWRSGKLAGSRLAARPGDRGWQRVDEVISARRKNPSDAVLAKRQTAPPSGPSKQWLLITLGFAVLSFAAGGVVGCLVALEIQRSETQSLVRSEDPDAIEAGTKGPGTSRRGTASPLDDQVILVKNSIDKFFRIRLGDYTWTDYGLKNFWGREIGGIDTVTPIGPDAIAIVDQYLNATGARRVRTAEQANEWFISDVEAMTKPTP